MKQQFALLLILSKRKFNQTMEHDLKKKKKSVDHLNTNLKYQVSIFIFHIHT